MNIKSGGKMTHTQHTKLIFKGGNNQQKIGASSHIIEHTNENGDISRIMIDLGILFTPENKSISCITPDISTYLGLDKKMRETHNDLHFHHNQMGGTNTPKLDAIFLTHMHEDHIGGLVQLAKCGYIFPPIYASRETIALIDNLVKDFDENISLPLRPINGETAISKDMIVSPFPVSHTTVGSYGFHTLTKVNNQPHAGILHMGDFNLAPAALGKGYDEQKFTQFLHHKFITHVLIDSTSAHYVLPNFTTHIESQTNYEKLMYYYNDRRIVSSLNSRSTQNLIPILRAAKNQNRTVFLDGHKQREVYNALQKTGVLEEFKNTVFFHNHIKESNLPYFLKKFTPGEQVIIFSGAITDNKDLSKTTLSDVINASESMCKKLLLRPNNIMILGQRLIDPDMARGKPISLFHKVPLMRSGHATSREIYDIVGLIHTYKQNNDDIHVVPVHGTRYHLENTQEALKNTIAKVVFVKNNDYIWAAASQSKVVNPNRKKAKKLLGFKENPATKSIDVVACNMGEKDDHHYIQTIRPLATISSPNNTDCTLTTQTKVKIAHGQLKIKTTTITTIGKQKTD